MPRRTSGRPVVEPRIRTFFGGEGIGEKALSHWLEDLRNADGRQHHHDVHNLRGGDILSLVENALKKRKKRDLPQPNRFVKSFLLLDYDRYVQDGGRTQEAERIAQDAGLVLIWQTPMLEGLLLRLFPGRETLQPPAAEIDGLLGQKWPSYKKSFSRQDLNDRFKLDDLKRAAQFDPHLRKLLRELGLGG